MEGAGFADGTGALGQEIGEVLDAEGVEGEGVLEGASGGVASVDFDQGESLLDVMGEVGTPLTQLLEVGLGLRAQGEELDELELAATLTPLGEEFLLVLGVDDIPVTVVGAGMFGDRALLVVEEQTLGAQLEPKALAGEAGVRRYPWSAGRRGP